jgi:hypothetical protein
MCKTQFLKYFSEESCKSCSSIQKADKCVEFDECSANNLEYFKAGFDSSKKEYEEKLKKQFRLTLFEKQILITVEKNHFEAIQTPIFTKHKIKIGEHDFLETKENSLNYYECCGVLKLFGIEPPTYDYIINYLA